MEAIIEASLITVNAQAVQEDHVEELVELLENGRVLPPITVRKVSDAEYRVVDGRHRLEAQRRLGRTHVRVHISL